MSLVPRLSWGHLTDADCITTALTVCPDAESAPSQLQRLRQYGLLTASMSGCVAPTSLLPEQTAVTSPETQRMVLFVKAVTGISSTAQAKRCLNRLIAARFQTQMHHATQNATALLRLSSPRIDSEGVAVHTAKRFVLTELSLLRSAWEREKHYAASASSPAHVGSHQAMPHPLLEDVGVLPQRDRTHADVAQLCMDDPTYQSREVSANCDAQLCVLCEDLRATPSQTITV